MARTDFTISPYGPAACPVCGGDISLNKNGTLRHHDADNIAAIGPRQARAFAALLEAVADDDPEDPLHDPDCRTCNAALDAARAYLGEEAVR